MRRKTSPLHDQDRYLLVVPMQPEEKGAGRIKWIMETKQAVPL
jgi:hypothetical protein